ncbi:MAG TPA: hypothetical protein VKP65_26055 [Rhodothermales bacterium]|nr:hypothetical protein [Rhodothermales bacterium]
MYISLRYALLFLIFLFAGCASTRTDTAAPSADAVAVTQSIASFAKYMEGEGVAMRLNGLPEQPYTATDAQRYAVGGDESLGGRMEVYKFASHSEARQAIGRFEIERGGAPNIDFYVQDRLVVVYYGNDREVNDALTAVLRPI